MPAPAGPPPVISPGEVTTLDELRARLGPRPPDGRAIALIGGAGGLDAADREALAAFFGRLATHLDATGTAVVDGGTDSGVMRMIADARAALGGTFRLVGIVPRGALERTTRDGTPIEVAPEHEVVPVPGDAFGDESTWLFAAADHLAGGDAPTVVVNGGRLTLDEAEDRLAGRHLVVVVGGSGRAADTLAADARAVLDERLRVLDMTADAAAIAAALDDARRVFASGPGPDDSHDGRREEHP